MLGIVLLQQMEDLTDEETVRQFAFNIEWHYALLPAIEDATKRELAPTELLADSLYGSDDNVEKARELGVEVVSPAMGSAPDGISLADFSFSEADEMVVCPVKREKRNSTLSYDAKSLRLARRRAKEKTEAFREVYRFRAGAEATMSDLDRITRIKHLRVRGMPQVRLAAVLKATGLNILRATAFKNRLQQQEKQKTGANPSHNGLIEAVKEQYQRLRDYLRPLAGAFCPGDYRIGCLMPQAA